jgi:hypothetical protein
MIHQPPPGFGRSLGRQAEIRPRQRPSARPGDAGRQTLRYWPTEGHHPRSAVCPRHPCMPTAIEDRIVVTDALGTQVKIKSEVFRDHVGLHDANGNPRRDRCRGPVEKGRRHGVLWRSAAPEPELPVRDRLAIPSDHDQSGQVPPATQCERGSGPRALAGTPCPPSMRLLHARQDADIYRAGSRRGALPQHIESGAREVPPTLTVQNDLIWTVLTLIGILPVSTQIDGSARCYLSWQRTLAGWQPWLRAQRMVSRSGYLCIFSMLIRGSIDLAVHSAT